MLKVFSNWMNPEFERFQDSGNAFSRVHSDFGKIVDYEANRAVQVFDSASLESELPDSFSHEFIIPDRLSAELLEEMIIQEHIAQKIVDEIRGIIAGWRNSYPTLARVQTLLSLARLTLAEGTG